MVNGCLGNQQGDSRIWGRGKTNLERKSQKGSGLLGDKLQPMGLCLIGAWVSAAYDTEQGKAMERNKASSLHALYTLSTGIGVL